MSLRPKYQSKTECKNGKLILQDRSVSKETSFIQHHFVYRKPLQKQLLTLDVFHFIYNFKISQPQASTLVTNSPVTSLRYFLVMNSSHHSPSLVKGKLAEHSKKKKSRTRKTNFNVTLEWLQKFLENVMWCCQNLHKIKECI